MQPIFITGIGTDVGKTIVSAIVTEALQADYWKPVQAGFDTGTDALTVAHLITNKVSKFHKEVYKLQLPASPHISAREESASINLDIIANAFSSLSSSNSTIIIEGAGGLLVPLNENEFVIDLIEKLHAKVILVSRNYLGSINHSLLTAAVCRQRNIDVIGWVFNDHYMNYEQEIVHWSGLPKIASIPLLKSVTPEAVLEQAHLVQPALIKYL